MSCVTLSATEVELIVGDADGLLLGAVFQQPVKNVMGEKFDSC
jgi:hypothetical protein